MVPCEHYTDKMLNMTTWLAVVIKHLPEWEVNCNDTTPQADLASVTISELLPTEADGTVLHKWAVEHNAACGHRV